MSEINVCDMGLSRWYDLMWFCRNNWDVITGPYVKVGPQFVTFWMICDINTGEWCRLGYYYTFQSGRKGETNNCK